MTDEPVRKADGPEPRESPERWALLNVFNRACPKCSAVHRYAMLGCRKVVFFRSEEEAKSHRHKGTIPDPLPADFDGETVSYEEIVVAAALGDARERAASGTPPELDPPKH